MLYQLYGAAVSEDAGSKATIEEAEDLPLPEPKAEQCLSSCLLILL